MKILRRHLLSSMMLPFFYTMTGFTFIYIIYDLFNNMGEFFDAKMPFLVIVQYYLLTLPTFLIIVIPVCLMLSVLYCLSNMTRHSEIVAMRACGVSIYAIAAPFIWVGIIASIGTHFINEELVPTNAFRAEQLIAYHGREKKTDSYNAYALVLKMPRRGRDWFVKEFDTRDYSMKDARVTQQHEDGLGSTRYTARRILRLDNKWYAMDVVTQHYDIDGNLMGAPEFELQRELSQIGERPSAFLSAIKDPEFMSSSELRKYVRYNPQLSKQNVAAKMVDMHHRLAYPWIGLIATMLAIPIGAYSGRNGTFSGVVITISLFFACFLMLFVTESLAKSGFIPPWAGAWSPIITFAIISMAGLNKMR